MAAVLTLFGLPTVVRAQDGMYNVLYDFHSGAGGNAPYAELVAFQGFLYGTTFLGGGGKKCGVGGCGTIFSIDPGTGMSKIEFSFQGGAKTGYAPLSGLTVVGNKLYGTTTSGGDNNCGFRSGCGVVFSFDPIRRIESVIHVFRGKPDGRRPQDSLVLVGHTLYGTTVGGGSADRGEVFSLDLDTGALTTVYSFKGGRTGDELSGSLLYLHGLLYGATISGGSGCQSSGCGLIYSIHPLTGKRKTVYAFKGGGDGAAPIGGLVNIGRTIYGTATEGGYTGSGCNIVGCGTVYSVDLSTGAEKTLYSFKGYPDAYEAPSALIHVGGLLYGTSSVGGVNDAGTIFSVDPKAGAETILHSFEGGGQGAYPEARLLAVGGTLYGTTTGASKARCGKDCGTVFQWRGIRGAVAIRGE